MRDRGDPILTKPVKVERKNSKKNHRENGETLLRERGGPLYSEIPELLQEFRENLVADRVPEHRDSHASSSHAASLEPIFKRRVDLGVNTVFILISLKTEIARICKRTKITRAPCRRRNGEAVPRAVNFGDLITADHKVLSDNCESRNNHRYAVVVQDLATQMDPGVSVQKQNFTRNPEKLAKVPGTREETKKSCTLTIPWNSEKLVKIFPGIIARLHHTPIGD